VIEPVLAILSFFLLAAPLAFFALLATIAHSFFLPQFKRIKLKLPNRVSRDFSRRVGEE
jgi:hypothetical protein